MAARNATFAVNSWLESDATQNFKVQSIGHLGKKAWAVVRHDRNVDPVIVLIHYASPALAFRDVNFLNIHAQAGAHKKPNESSAPT